MRLIPIRRGQNDILDGRLHHRLYHILVRSVAQVWSFNFLVSVRADAFEPVIEDVPPLGKAVDFEVVI